MTTNQYLTLDGRLGQMLRILDEVGDERRQQHRKWGEQNCPDFEWVSILTEEVGEAAKEANEANFANGKGAEAIPRLRQELIQVAAVAVAWIDAIDRKVGFIDRGGSE